MGPIEFFQSIYKGQDDEIDSWLLMQGPVPVSLILVAYLVFVFKVGPAFMKNRQPFTLKNVLLVYNIFQIIYNIYMFIGAIQVNQIAETLVDSECSVERNRQQYMAVLGLGWHYLMAKVTDLLDTIFFVLRKKTNQITFLHVYHHTAMVIMGWIVVKYVYGEQLLVVGLLNTFVHVLMYTYYLVSAMGPQYQKYLWWKKYITTIQLIQFALIIAYMLAVTFKGCEVPLVLTIFAATQALLFFYLFYSFYRNTYKAKNNSSKVK